MPTKKKPLSQVSVDQLMLPSFILGSLVLYSTTSNYGIVTDYLGWLNKYRAGGWAGIVNSFNYPGLHHFFHLVNFTIYKVIGPHLWGLYILFAMAHGIASYAFYKFLREIGNSFQYPKHRTIAFITSILFATSPYSAEVVTWKACFHYIMIVVLLSWTGVHYIRYLKKEGAIYKYLVLFALSLFTLEVSLVYPGILFLLGMMFFIVIDKSSLNRWLTSTLINALMLASYFILNKLILGAWVGHYGAEKHLNFSPSLIMSTANKYVLKYAGYVHFAPNKIKNTIYGLIDQPIVMLLITSIIVAIIGFLFYHIIKKNLWAVPGLLGIAGFLIGILPVVNLFFVTLHPYENDRYGYFASGFIYLIMVTLLLKIRSKIKYVLLLALIILNLALTFKLNQQINDAGTVINSLCHEYKDTDAETVITSLPENHNGIYMFRDLSNEGSETFIESVDWLENKKIKGLVYVLSQYNMKDMSDHLNATIIGVDQVKVFNKKNGSWLWRMGAGLQSYDKKYANLQKGNLSYEAKIKVPKAYRILHPSGSDWKIIK